MTGSCAYDQGDDDRRGCPLDANPSISSHGLRWWTTSFGGLKAGDFTEWSCRNRWIRELNSNWWIVRRVEWLGRGWDPPYRTHGQCAFERGCALLCALLHLQELTTTEVDKSGVCRPIGAFYSTPLVYKYVRGYTRLNGASVTLDPLA